MSNKISELFRTSLNSIAVLIDPGKATLSDEFLKKINSSGIDFLFIGGSTSNKTQLNSDVIRIKKICEIPIIIFPGSPDQLSKHADAILFLSLISGRNPYYLIQSQIEAAEEIYNSKIECISTSYLLIDGLTESTVSKVSNTKPIPIEDPKLIFKTALAGKLLGHSITYLEAGSGAKRSIPLEIVKKTSELNSILIVGGGIKSIEQIRKFHKAGANIVVVGNHIESNPEFLDKISRYKNP